MALNVIIPQADSVINQTIIPATAYSSSDTAGPFAVDFFSSAEITFAVTSCSGTINFYIQKLLADNSTWDDVASWPQFVTGVFTTTGAVVLSFVNGGNTINVAKDATLTANTVNTVHFGSYWRAKFVLTGASATSTFGVYGNFRS